MVRIFNNVRSRHIYGKIIIENKKVGGIASSNELLLRPFSKRLTAAKLSFFYIS
jgi:hypothetical protein